MRWQRTAAVIAAVVASCALLAASPAVAADEPVATCPPGKVSLKVAPAAQGTFTIGAFSMTLPVDPWKAASPKANTPPSRPTSQ